MAYIYVISPYTCLSVGDEVESVAIGRDAGRSLVCFRRIDFCSYAFGFTPLSVNVFANKNIQRALGVFIYRLGEIQQSVVACKAHSSCLPWQVHRFAHRKSHIIFSVFVFVAPAECLNLLKLTFVIKSLIIVLSNRHFSCEIDMFFVMGYKRSGFIGRCGDVFCLFGIERKALTTCFGKKTAPRNVVLCLCLQGLVFVLSDKRKEGLKIICCL